MEVFKKWLDDELNEAIETVKNIPSESRKGIQVAMLRKRARDAVTVLQFITEFETATCSKNHLDHTEEGLPY